MFQQLIQELGHPGADIDLILDQRVVAEQILLSLEVLVGTIKKMVRSGKYDGKITYKKTVVDRALAIEKKAKKG